MASSRFSTVEQSVVHPAVNRDAAGSSPARGDMKISSVSKGSTALLSTQDPCNISIEIENDADMVMVMCGVQLLVVKSGPDGLIVDRIRGNPGGRHSTIAP